MNTHVVISSGNVIIHSNTTIWNLTLGAGANVTVSSGVNFVVLH